MADAVPSESLRPIKQETTKSESRFENFKKWLRRENNKPREEPAMAVPTSEIEQRKTVSELLGVPEADSLKRAPKLLFHTTHESRVESIKATGIIAGNNSPTIGENLAYSVFFGLTKKYPAPILAHIKIDEIRQETPDDYVLTIWRDNQHLIKFKDRLEDRFRVNTHSDRVIPAENFVGSTRLTGKSRDNIIRFMADAEAGIYDAAHLEKLFSFTMRLPDEIGHGMAAYVEQTLIRASIMKQLQEIKGNADSSLKCSTLLQAIFLRSKVNDRVSAKYLDSAIAGLSKDLNEAGVNADSLVKEDVELVLNFNKNPKTAKPIRLSVDQAEYYGNRDWPQHAAMQIKELLGMTRQPTS